MPQGPARTRMPRMAQAAERARLRVVPRPHRSSARAPFVVLVALLLVVGVAGLLAFNTSMQQASFKVTALQARAAALAAREQSLQMELDTLRDPQHVAEAAHELGMVLPASPAFIRLADKRILGTPKPAVAVDAMRIDPLPPPKPRSLKSRVNVITRYKTPEQIQAQRRLDRARQDLHRAGAGAVGVGTTGAAAGSAR